jgi:hypothetical protein
MVRTRKVTEFAPPAGGLGGLYMVPSGESAEFYPADEAASPVKQASNGSEIGARRAHVHARVHDISHWEPVPEKPLPYTFLRNARYGFIFRRYHIGPSYQRE